MAVLSVLELPNMRTTREINAESLVAVLSDSWLQITSGAGAATEAPGLAVEGLVGPKDENDRIECIENGPAFGSSTWDDRGFRNCSNVEELICDGCGGSIM